jgi:hypothetical protein
MDRTEQKNRRTAEKLNNELSTRGVALENFFLMENKTLRTQRNGPDNAVA